MPALYIVAHVNYDISTLCPTAIELIRKCKYFISENPSRLSKFLFGQLGIRDVYIVEFSARNKEKESLKEVVSAIHKFGMGILMSDSGNPVIGDPGGLVVHEAHNQNIRVVSLPGPSPVIMSLTSSGMYHQRFMFYGYLPVDKKEKRNAIKKLSLLSQDMECGIVIIEVPHRAWTTLLDLVYYLPESFFLSISINIMSSDERVIMGKISWWRNVLRDEEMWRGRIHKQQCTFVIWHE